jgi:hypothetical protein
VGIGGQEAGGDSNGNARRGQRIVGGVGLRIARLRPGVEAEESGRRGRRALRGLEEA